MNKIFKCLKCGSVAEILSNNSSPLTCCDKQMIHLKENTEEASTEKHIPVMEKNGNNITVTVGSVEHPMEKDHLIEWIEILTQNKVYRKYLKVGEKPMAKFYIDSEVSAIRAYCNLHGLWKHE